MTTEQQRLLDGLELLLSAANQRVRASVYGVEGKCQVGNGKSYLLEGEDLCKAAVKAANDLLAVVAEYRDTERQLRALRVEAATAQ